MRPQRTSAYPQGFCQRFLGPLKERGRTGRPRDGEHMNVHWEIARLTERVSKLEAQDRMKDLEQRWMVEEARTRLM